MSSLQTLVRTLGVQAVTKATEERYLRLLLDAEDDHPVLLQHLTNLAATDMYLLEDIVACRPLVTAEPEFVAGLLRAAFRRAGGKQREFVSRIATKAGLADRLPQDVSEKLRCLTPSQRLAFERIREMANTYFHHRHAPTNPVKLRLTALLIGCSGVGKSHIARLVAEEMNARLVVLTVGSWVPHGAKLSPTTIEVITDALSSDAPLVVFLDELDKYRIQDNSWALAQMAEAFALLDRTLIGDDKWTKEHTRRLRENTLLLGAGTWSDLWRDKIGKHVGFTSSQIDVDEVRAKVRTANLIPEELLARFNSDWQIIAPYTAADFELIARQLNLPREVLDPLAAERSGRNFRYVEDCVTRAAIESNRLQRMRRVDVSVSQKNSGERIARRSSPLS